MVKNIFEVVQNIFEVEKNTFESVRNIFESVAALAATSFRSMANRSIKINVFCHSASAGAALTTVIVATGLDGADVASRSALALAFSFSAYVLTERIMPK